MLPLVAPPRSEDLAMLASLLQALPSGVALFDHELRYVYVNPAWVMWDGIAAEAHVSRLLADIQPHLADIFRPILQQVYATGESLFHLTLPVPTGAAADVKMVHASAHPVFGAQHVANGVCFVLQAQQDEQHTAAALEEREQRYRDLFEQAYDIVCVFDLQANILAVNSAVERVTGYSREELIGQPIFRFFADDQAAIIQEMVNRKLAGTSVTSYELALKTKDGRRVLLDINTRLVFSNGQPVEIHGIARDITARRLADESIERTARLQVTTAALATTQTPSQVAQVILSQGIATVGATAGSIALLNDEGKTFEILGAVGFPDSSQVIPGPISETSGFIVADVAQRRVPVLIETLDEWYRRYPATAEAADRSGFRSTAVIPLLLDMLLLGVLSIHFDQARTFQRDEIAMLINLAQQCAQALERARLYEAELQARQRAELVAERTLRLQKVTAAFADAVTAEQVIDVIVQQGIPAMGAYAGFMVLCRADEPIIDLVAVTGFPRTVRPRSSTGRHERFPLVTAVVTGEPVWLPTPESFYEYSPDYPPLVAPATKASASVPLMQAGQAIGALAFSYTSPQAFAEDDRAAMLALAEQCAQALERTRLIAAIKAQAEQLSILADLSHRFATVNRDLPALLDQLTRQVAEIVGDFATVSLVSVDGTHHEIASFHHVDPQIQALVADVLVVEPQQLDQGLSKTVFVTGKPLHIPQVPSDMLQGSIDPVYAPYLSTYPVYSLAVVPIRAHEHIFGLLAVLRTTPDKPYTKDDVKLLEAIADRAALGIQNARLYDAAQAAVSVRDQFLSVAVHELRTPLTALLGNAQMLYRRMLAEAADTERFQRSVAVIQSQAMRLDSLICTLLDVSRLQTGQLSISLAPLELSSLVRQVIEEVQVTLDAHHNIHYEADNPLYLLGDSLRIEQVIQNLINNAIKYSPSGGTVRVRLSRNSDQAEISVADSGVGIPQSAIPNLFARFYRAPNVSGGYISGMGIGLYVVKEIVTLHGGQIAVESTEGRGSTFTVQLPLYQLKR